MSFFDWIKSLFKKKNIVPLVPRAKAPSEVMESIFRSFIGKHEDGNSNRAAWLDVIERKAGMIGQPWCAIIIFWEIIPSAEEILGRKSVLVPSAGVRKGASLNKKHLHKMPLAGDIGYLGTKNSWTGHQIYVVSVGKDSKGIFVDTIEGNTSSNDPKSRNGGEVASHRRYIEDKNSNFEVLGFATPFPV